MDYGRDFVTTSTGDPIRLHDGAAPGSESWTHSEMAYWSDLFGNEVVTNVVVPTITPVIAEEPCGTSVIVAPGGAFHALSIDSEGFDVARWLAARGVSAYVLKYRLVPSGDDAVAEIFEKTPEQLQSEMATISPLAGDDGMAAVRVVRARAPALGLDPKQVGFMGFSAGGNVALRVAFSADAASRPDFLAPIYPGGQGVSLDAPPAEAGPMFLAAATDDPLGLADDTMRVYDAWRSAGHPAELHLYGAGGHGFGMKSQGLPSDSWIDRFGEWLSASGLMPLAPG